MMTVEKTRLFAVTLIVDNPLVHMQIRNFMNIIE